LAPHGDPRCRALLDELLAFAGADGDAAGRLIDRYGSLGAILTTNREALAAIAEDSEAADLLDCVHRIVGHVLRQDIEDRPLIGNEPAVIAYLRSRSAHSRNEELRILYLGAKNHLIHEQVFPGTIDEAPFLIREILRRGLDVGAASIVLAHNHPSGEAVASEADCEMTRQLIRAGYEVGISVVDHIIVTRTGSLSFRLSGLF